MNKENGIVTMTRIQESTTRILPQVFDSESTSSLAKILNMHYNIFQLIQTIYNFILPVMVGYKCCRLDISIKVLMIIKI